MCDSSTGMIGGIGKTKSEELNSLTQFTMASVLHDPWTTAFKENFLEVSTFHVHKHWGLRLVEAGG